MRRVLEVKVLFAGNVLRVAYLAPQDCFTVGDVPGADLPLPLPTFALWGTRELTSEFESWPIEQTELSLLLAYVDAPERVGRGGRRKIPFWALGIATALHAVLLIAAFALPPVPVAAALAFSVSPPRGARRWAYGASWTPGTRGARPARATQSARRTHAPGKPAPLARGHARSAARRRKAKTPLGLRHLPRPPSSTDAVAAARSLVRKLTVSLGSNAALASVFGQRDALGAEPAAALRGLSGSPHGEAYGLAGLAVRGAGRGGGGSGAGAIKVSLRTSGGGGTGYGTTCGTIYARGGGQLGRARGCGLGSISGYGSGTLGSHGMNGPPRVAFWRASVCGNTTSAKGCGLSKEQIRRAVRRHINEIRYCYVRELSLDRKLSGRLLLRFVVDSNGLVVSSRVAGSTLGNAHVATCAVHAVRRWRFPKPGNGNLVVVTYPFVFRTPGS